MTTNKYFQHNLSDSKIFQMDAFDILELSTSALNEMVKIKGHYTHKINPLACKKMLYENDFYYCDTLLEPYCSKHTFNYFENELATFGEIGNLDDIINICNNSFTHGRFHRDFKLNKIMAEQRYKSWLTQLYDEKHIYTLYYSDNLAGFVGYTNNKLVLHAMDSKYRGKGLAKYLWSRVCEDLFNKGHQEITSSVSATNLAAINLYSSLGFKFRNAVDVYHRIVE